MEIYSIASYISFERRGRKRKRREKKEEEEENRALCLEIFLEHFHKSVEGEGCTVCLERK